MLGHATRARRRSGSPPRRAIDADETSGGEAAAVEIYGAKVRPAYHASACAKWSEDPASSRVNVNEKLGDEHVIPMFRALHSTTHEEFISLDEKWRTRVEELRRLDHDNALSCPECNGSVRLKAGEYNRWHFSHKIAASCPLTESDPVRIQMRAQIYNWLASKQPKLKLGIEERLQIDGATYVVDCTVDLSTPTGNIRVGYLALTAGIRQRAPLLMAVKRAFRYCHWIFHVDTVPISDGKQGIILSKTHRDVIQSCVTVRSNRDALHILDPKSETLITHRLLTCVHHPQVYRGRIYRSHLGSVLVGPRTGELLHGDEADAYRTRSSPHLRPKARIFCEKCGQQTIRWVRLTKPGWGVCEECV